MSMGSGSATSGSMLASTVGSVGPVALLAGTVKVAEAGTVPSAPAEERPETSEETPTLPSASTPGGGTATVEGTENSAETPSPDTEAAPDTPAAGRTETSAETPSPPAADVRCAPAKACSTAPTAAAT